MSSHGRVLLDVGYRPAVLLATRVLVDASRMCEADGVVRARRAEKHAVAREELGESRLARALRIRIRSDDSRYQCA
jgi:hypothetical protein